jgi:hypothetical protein
MRALKTVVSWFGMFLILSIGVFCWLSWAGHLDAREGDMWITEQSVLKTSLRPASLED